MTIHKFSDSEVKVKNALDVWAEWSQRDQTEVSLGYGRCVGFDNGSSTKSWDDFEHKVEKNLAINVQAIYEGLNQPQQMAVDHFHLSAVWKPQRYRIEDAYAEALMVIEIALRRRGLL